MLPSVVIFTVLVVIIGAICTRPAIAFFSLLPIALMVIVPFCQAEIKNIEEKELEEQRKAEEAIKKAIENKKNEGLLQDRIYYDIDDKF